jgi:hypothetical protein
VSEISKVYSIQSNILKGVKIINWRAVPAPMYSFIVPRQTGRGSHASRWRDQHFTNFKMLHTFAITTPVTTNGRVKQAELTKGWPYVSLTCECLTFEFCNTLWNLLLPHHVDSFYVHTCKKKNTHSREKAEAANPDFGEIHRSQASDCNDTMTDRAFFYTAVFCHSNALLPRPTTFFICFANMMHGSKNISYDVV